MADKLTPQQAQAVLDRGGNLLVSAAAGSGKTKVLVDRLLTYLTDPKDPANLDEFLIITYTKAAASELRGKIAAKLTERIAREPENRHLQKQMQRLFLTKISTVHGFCSDILREYAFRLDIPADFRVGDESECRELRERVLADLLDREYANAEQDADFRAFVDTQGLGRDDRLVPEIIEKVYDSARCHLDPEAWLQKSLEASQTEHLADASETIWGRYLIADLQEYLDQQICVFEQCMGEMDRLEGFEKPADNIRSILKQLKTLRSFDDWDSISKHQAIDYGRLTFSKKIPDLQLRDQVKAVRDACKKGLERKLHSFADDSRQVMQDLGSCAGGVRGLTELVRKFEEQYGAVKRSRRILDFSDLEHKTLDLLLGKSRSGPTAAAREIGNRFREILVDEYQDSNGVQDSIFEALTSQRQNCFLVGDVKQSIYQFRLADPSIFLEKYHRYAPAAEARPKQGRKVLLSHNFRSGAEVIEGVNHVFGTCMRPKVGGLYYTEAEALREGVSHAPLPDPGVELYALEVQEEAYGEEAAFTAAKIKEMLGTQVLVRGEGGLRPVQPEDIVILLRSPGSAAGCFQRALEAQGIRCSTGGGTDLLQTEEIASLRAFLQTIQNPRQDIPLVSVLASPIFGFTADDLAAFRAGKKKGSIYDALLQSETPKARFFLKTLSILRQEARMQPLTDLLESCFRLTRLDSIYGAMSGGDGKRENLQIFYQLAADFEKAGRRDLAQFLDHLEALEERGMVMASPAGQGCVNIMSIHKSKGLEFPVVFLCNLSRKFNRESLRAQILCDKELGMGLSVADNINRVRYPSAAKRAIAAKMLSESVSEEMRVLYVAMTRARDRLVMTYASKYLQNVLQDLALRMDFDQGALLCQDASCMGDWVLLSAMQRMEAAQLHFLGGRPKNTVLTDHPWKIEVTQAPALAGGEAVVSQLEASMPEYAEEKLRRAMAFRYPHGAATQAPSKQTATDRKGREKDAEAAEHTQEPKQIRRSWRQPSFLSREIQGRAYGSAIHAALQHLRYENCGSREEIAGEIQCLVDQGLLSAEQGSLVNCGKLAAFFATDLGRKLRSGVPHIREFKFSILDDGSHYGEGLEGEQVLLQGVVDCALLEEDGITVIDFKTDQVTEETLSAVTARYQPQVQTYGDALGRIYEMPVKAQYLYFFRLDRFVKV